MSALQVCSIIKKAFLNVRRETEIILSPMADGGEGTVDTLVESLNGRYIEALVKGPSGKKIMAKFGLIDSGKTAVIEMSSASGLWLLKPNDRNPMLTTTYGTGQLIKKAIEMGVKKVIIGIGGSATNDGGMGAACAAGIKFFDKNENILEGCGKNLLSLCRIDASGIMDRIKETSVLVACDVDNPLYGKRGAAYVYAPQKGADENMVKLLDEGLKNLSGIIKRDLKKDISDLKGGGAAGGLGAGLSAFFGAGLFPGTDIIIQATNLEQKIKDADLIITGEGAMDNQTFYGKSAYGVAVLAKKYNIPVITINGSVNIDYNSIGKDKLSLFDGNFDIIQKDMNIEYAIKNGEKLLFSASSEIARFYFGILS
ncbi:MAG: glycerate kinase [Actinobacteria bacterium]|nr:glycerate kinase [Actinomycetota bacterium]